MFQAPCVEQDQLFGNLSELMGLGISMYVRRLPRSLAATVYCILVMETQRFFVNLLIERKYLIHTDGENRHMNGAGTKEVRYVSNFIPSLSNAPKVIRGLQTCVPKRVQRDFEFEFKTVFGYFF
jgi:hypothetical protein